MTTLLRHFRTYCCFMAARTGQNVGAQGQNLYKRWIRLARQWPVDETKDGRCLGQFLRFKIPHELSIERNEPDYVCERRLNSLERLRENRICEAIPRKNSHGYLPADNPFILKLFSSTETVVLRNQINSASGLFDWIRRCFGFLPSTEAEEIGKLPVYQYAKRIGATIQRSSEKSSDDGGARSPVNTD